MKRWIVIIVKSLITVVLALAFVRNFFANDPIHYFADQPQRLLLVAVIAGGGGALVWAFTRLSLRIRCGLALLWRYTVALLVAYFVAWIGAFIYLCYSTGESLRLSSCLFFLFLAWTSDGSQFVAAVLGDEFAHTLNHALIYSVIGFIPLAVLAVVLVQRFGRQQ